MASNLLTQDGRWLKLGTPLGEDVVVAEEMNGREEISRPFRFYVAGLAAQAFAPSAILGGPVSLQIERYAGAGRTIHGIATAVRLGPTVRGGYQRVEIDVEPSICVLRHSGDYRIFQEKSVVDIAEAVFAARSVTNYRFSLSGTPATRAYCVQFGETDLDFLHRILEEDGLFYYFEHAASGHTMVIADDAVGYGEAGEATLVYGSPDALGPNLAQSLAFGHALADMKTAFRQFDFEAPATPVDGEAKSSLELTTAWSAWEHFRYGAGAPVAANQTAKAKQDTDAADANSETLEGRSSSATLAPGYPFTLDTDWHGEATTLDGAPLSGATFVAVRVEHRLVDPAYLASRPRAEEVKASYGNSFAAIPATRAFRPRHPVAKPLAFGPQTAIVVGPSGNEVYTDEHGRVRVQFHWDRVGQKNETSSCFVRVAQAWAGNGWGTQFIPRVGMEVVVHFLEGDPDQPLVTGVLYNGVNKPPFALTAQMNKSGLRTRSTKSGTTDTFSELSFDDTKDSEMVLFHAQKDFNRVVENDDVLDVRHDQTRTVKNNRTTTISDGNDETTISTGNRTETIAKGNETLKIDAGNRSVTLAKGNDELKLTAGNLSVELDGGDMSVALALGNLTQSCDAGSVTIEALQGITLKCGQSTIEIKPQGITVKGPLVTLQATGKAELSGAMVDVKGSGVTQVNGSIVKIN